MGSCLQDPAMGTSCFKNAGASPDRRSADNSPSCSRCSRCISGAIRCPESIAPGGHSSRTDSLFATFYVIAVCSVLSLAVALDMAAGTKKLSHANPHTRSEIDD
jgi:hypothetical protein